MCSPLGGGFWVAVRKADQSPKESINPTNVMAATPLQNATSSVLAKSDTNTEREGEGGMWGGFLCNLLVRPQ